MNWRNYSFIVTCLVIGLGIALLVDYMGRGWITFENAAHIATVVAAAVGTITLIIIAAQLILQARLARAANSQSFVSVASQFVLAISADHELSKLWHTGGAEYDKMDHLEKARYRYLVAWWLTFFENLLYQCKCGLIDQAIYNAWAADEFGFIGRRRVEKVWLELRPNYSDDFVSHFEVILKAQGFEFPSLKRDDRIAQRLRCSG